MIMAIKRLGIFKILKKLLKNEEKSKVKIYQYVRKAMLSAAFLFARKLLAIIVLFSVLHLLQFRLSVHKCHGMLD